MVLPKRNKRSKYYQRVEIFSNAKNLRLIKKRIDFVLNKYNYVESNLESTVEEQTTHEIAEETVNLDEFELPECPICYNVLEQDTNYCVTECNHTFCFNCIARSIRRDNKCPLCRATLDKSDENTNSQNQETQLSSSELATLLQNATVHGLERERRVLHDDFIDELETEDHLFQY